jgi:predicted transcriptional regulator
VDLKRRLDIRALLRNHEAVASDRESMPNRSLPSRAVVGAEALAAVAVPARLALLNHLLAAGPRTASQCAPVVGESPSNCSWHLRALAKVGLVERAAEPAADGRTRPWQATEVGFDFSGEGGPAAQLARTALAGMSAEHEDDLYRRYLARRELLPGEWTTVSGANRYALELTPDELESLVERLEGLIRPYVRPIRTDAPEGSAIVHVTLRAFLNPDVHENPSEA